MPEPAALKIQKSKSFFFLSRANSRLPHKVLQPRGDVKSRKRCSHVCCTPFLMHSWYKSTPLNFYKAQVGGTFVLSMCQVFIPDIFDAFGSCRFIVGCHFETYSTDQRKGKHLPRKTYGPHMA